MSSSRVHPAKFQMIFLRYVMKKKSVFIRKHWLLLIEKKRSKHYRYIVSLPLAELHGNLSRFSKFPIGMHQKELFGLCM